MTSSLLTKTDFIRYIECPLYAWLNKHRKDLWQGHKHGNRAAEGEEVEGMARELFPGGIEVKANYEEGARDTDDFMANGHKVIYQATAISDKYLARADILIRANDGMSWDLYEVKSSNSAKKEHIADLCFQRLAFFEAGITIRSIHLIHLNKEYRFDTEKGLEHEKLFLVEDMTHEVQEAFTEYETKINEAWKVLTSKEEPKVPVLKKKFDYEQPQAFLDYYHRDIPNYSIYDITRIARKDLVALSEEGIRKIEDIPDDFFKNNKQNLQVELTKKKTSQIDTAVIQEELEALEYPLYFLDYETINPAIPFLDRQSPHQQVPFQYSLHIIEEPRAELQHREFLHTEKTTPIPALAESLRNDIREGGTVIVWYQPFEKGRNKEIGERYTEYEAFMESVNARVYDLMVIFKEKYMDYRFKGSASIKNVLPVLIPEMDYKSLEVQNGTMASEGILDLIEGKVEDAEGFIRSLKEYCKQDTLAMVRIFELLRGLKA